MPREFPRSRRIEEAIQRTLSEALSGRTRDPRLAGVTITNVSVSRDLSVARVYFALLSGEPVSDEILAALRAAAGFFRSTVARELRTRTTPELRFFPDEALARGRALESLIGTAVGSDRTAASGADGRSIPDPPLPDEQDDVPSH